MTTSLKDWATSRRTELELRPGLPLLVAAIIVGIVAALLSPTVRVRSDADALGPVFVGFLAAIPTIAGFAASRANGRLRVHVVLAAVIGCAAAVAGLLYIDLNLYRYAFAVAVAALAFDGLALLVPSSKSQDSQADG